MILVEAEKKMLNEMDDKDGEGNKSNESENNENSNDSSSDEGSEEDKSKTGTTKRRNLGQKRTNATPHTSGGPFTEEERAKFERDYSDLTITGKSCEYYKSNSTLEFMKEH